METRSSVTAAAAGTPLLASTSSRPTLGEELVDGVQDCPEPMETTTTSASSGTNSTAVHESINGPQQDADEEENPESLESAEVPPVAGAKRRKKRAANEDDKDAATKPGPSKRGRKGSSEDSSPSTLEQSRAPTRARPQNNAEGWKHKFELLCAFHRENGHSRVPKNYVVESEKLGLWVKEQRRFYRNYLEKKKGVCTPINEERIAQLKSIGLEWNCNLATRTTRDDQWQRNLELLSAFQRENGHFRVPVDFVIDSIKLGQWVKNQRKYYKNRMAGKTGLRASITEERIAQLNAIGFRWNYGGEKEWRRDDAGWQKKFDLLCAFRREHGHCRVPNKFVVDSIKLGLWVENQKRHFKNYKKGKRGHGASITEERVSKLDSIGFEWKGDGVDGKNPLATCDDLQQENDNGQVRNI